MLLSKIFYLEREKYFLRVFKSFCHEKKKKTLLFIHTLVKEETRQKPTLFFEYTVHTLFFLFVGHSFPFGAISEKTLCRENTVALYTQMQDYSANRKSALGNFCES